MGFKLISTFEKELKKIKNKQFKEELEKIMMEAPDYTVEIPSSTSAKYHPLDEVNDPGGQTLHVKRVFLFAEEISRIYDYNSRNTDVILAAALLHDALKCGKKQEKHTRKDHMILVYEFIKEYVAANELDTTIKFMFRDVALACLYHYGRWGGPAVAKIKDRATVGMSAPVKRLCEHLHLADCLASRRSIYSIFQKEK